MKRRVYLATAGATLFAGCSALSGSETDEENGDENGNENGDENGSSDPINEDPGSFDEFEDLSKWTVMEGSMSADEERTHVGSQSARMDADESDTRVMIKREFDSPRDLSDELPALAFASDHDVNPIVQLSDTDGNRLLLQCAVEPDGSFARHDLGFNKTVGDPDLSSIAHTKISFWAGDREMSLWVDDYHFVKRPDTGKVLLEFPDESAAVDAAPALAEHDLPATAFVKTDYVGGSGYPSVDELESLQEDGWTIASEGATGTDLTALDAESQEAEITGAVSWLEDHGFDAEYFSYPLNRYDDTTLELVEKHHDLGFVGGFPGHGHVTNPAMVPRATNPDAEEAETLLEWTADQRTITTLSFRELENLDATLELVADLESNGDLEVITPADLASDYLHE
ncbi:polysaccharide deacetylase family protein [Haloterrigena sp. SYSU A558-1]|uniref:Polysaccharide deacetylase family protein n=1 Tax=Haloterrigena gelatinilytica TaxID=2741724 RepID=A0A8J8GM83_9EURY|nr:polysaccharide deacetylase family protein [Haloterrigena gelatinilytica]NUB90377.1 polysaccharide deacetylase family protein [Haloterrigena gelatinilytica]NUC73803.1 polysaccharide deacetylase family protein [Haloterrigena gelatinilytica]